MMFEHQPNVAHAVTMETVGGAIYLMNQECVQGSVSFTLCPLCVAMSSIILIIINKQLSLY